MAVCYHTNASFAVEVQARFLYASDAKMSVRLSSPFATTPFARFAPEANECPLGVPDPVEPEGDVAVGAGRFQIRPRF
jgi:hypothetical protein